MIEILVQQEINDSYIDVTKPLRMSRTEKGALLQLFIDNEISMSSSAALYVKLEHVVKEMQNSELIRQTKKWFVSMHHFNNYLPNYALPLTKKGGKSMPYEENEYDTVRLLNGKQSLDMKSLDPVDRSYPSTKLF